MKRKLRSLLVFLIVISLGLPFGSHMVMAEGEKKEETDIPLSYIEQILNANEDEQTLLLHYSEAASIEKPSGNSVRDANWEEKALPIGNGHIGAMIFGGIQTERIQMNEKTLWTGGPQTAESTLKYGVDAYGNTSYDDPAAVMANQVDVMFEEYYRSLEAGNATASLRPEPYLPANIGDSNVLGRAGLGNYQNFAETYIDFNHTEVSDYVRGLDLNTAISFTEYTSRGITYTREMFANYPQNVMVLRMESSDPGALEFTLRPEIPHKTTSGNYTTLGYGKEGKVTAENDIITLRGSLKQNGMIFEGQYKVIPVGGTMSAQNDANNDNGKITVSGADSAVIIIALGTDYANDYANDYRGDDPHDSVTERINEASALGYEKLLSNHLDDYQEIFHRVEMNLGGQFDPSITTDRLLSTYKSQKNDRYLEALYFQYGRYLLLSSSREDSLPANLQGIWSYKENPNWQSDYHTNINLQMNYWPAMLTNMPETAIALVEYVDSLREPGQVTFQKTWGIEPEEGDTEPGWVVNVSANTMGYTGNINHTASFVPTAAAFISQNLYDYFAYTQDLDYLDSTIYPVMREACKTYIKILEPGRKDHDADKLYVVPSYSSEHGPWTVGAIFDQQLVYNLFQDTVKAAEELGVADTTDKELVEQLKEIMPKLDIIQIGKDGQIKEWQQEVSYGNYANGARIGESGHRHVSMLMAMYPGNQITTETKEWMEAAKITLNKRGDAATGWSMGQKMNLWARTGDGNRAHTLYKNLLSTGTYPNLLDFHTGPIFQIDGNLGGTAGLAEMLLQSHAGIIDILPTLSSEWKEGFYSGLVARGDFEVSVKWVDSEPHQIEVVSGSGNDLKLRAEGMYKVIDSKNNEIEYTILDNGSMVLPTIEGETYIFVNQLKELQELIKKAESLDRMYYTEASFAELEKTLDDVRIILEQDDPSAEEIKEAAEKLGAAIDLLVLRSKDMLIPIQVIEYIYMLQEDADYAKADGWDAVNEKMSDLITLMDRKENDPEIDLQAGVEALLDNLNNLTPYRGYETASPIDSRLFYGFGPNGPDTSISHSSKGQWYQINGDKYLYGYSINCRSLNSYVEFREKASRFMYFAEAATQACYINVYIDGNLVAERIDTRESGSGTPSVVFFDSKEYELDLDPREEHVIKVETVERSSSDSNMIFRCEGFGYAREVDTLPDKTEMILTLAEAKVIDPALLNKEMYDQLQQYIFEAENLLTDITSTGQEIENVINKIKDVLNNINPQEAEKKYLKIVIDYADEIMQSKEYPGTIIKLIQNKFEDALKYAKDIYNDKTVTQEQVDEAKESLVTVIHYLKFTADLEGLQEAIDHAENVAGSGLYEEDEAMNTFRELIEEAKNIKLKEDTLDEDIQDITAKLAEAESKLNRRSEFDLSFLLEEIRLAEIVEKVLEEKYIDINEDNYKEFRDALKWSKSVLESPQSQDEINSAAEKLLKARMELRLKPSKEALKQLMDQAEGKRAEDYTPASFAILLDAMQDARQVYENPYASAAEITRAMDKLLHALDMLEEVQDETEETESTKQTESDSEETEPSSEETDSDIQDTDPRSDGTEEETSKSTGLITGNGGKAGAKTGDNNIIEGLIMLMFISFMGCIAVIAYKRKSKVHK